MRVGWKKERMCISDMMDRSLFILLYFNSLRSFDIVVLAERLWWC